MRKVKYYLREISDPSIIQYGPPRTGSTLLWNVLRAVCHEKDVQRCHRLSRFRKSVFCRSPIIVSVRNPIDCISSSIQRFEKVPSNEVLNEQLAMYERNGIWDLLEVKNKSNALIMKYENFYQDWDYIFSKIEGFLQIKISDNLKKECIDNFSIEQVEKKSKALGSFSNYDKNDFIHGKHISEYKGKVGHGEEYLPAELVEKIYTKFKVIFDEFGYSKPVVI